jgi:MATE family, multidrug efflux pump
MNPRSKRASLTEGNLKKQIIRLSIPMMFGMFGISIFNIVDTIYVGRLGTKQLAALSFTYPVVLVLNSIALGMGIGASSVISRALGSGDHHKVIRLTTDSLSLSFLFIVVFVILGELTIEPLFTLLGARGEILEMIKSYMRIWYAGLIFVVFPMVGNNAIRALGDTKTPGIIMMIAGFVNIIVDPLLIFGIGPFPRWGIAGAAVATVFARSITFIVAMYVLVKREKIVSFKRVAFSQVLDSWKKILFVGGPAAITRLIVPVAGGVITALLASVGTHAVAGFGAAVKVERFALLFTMSMAVVMAPFAGQNYGAGKYRRIIEGIQFSSLISLGIGIVLLIGMFVFARPLAYLFTKDPQVVSVCVLYFRIVPLVYGLQGVFNISSMVFNALNKPFHAASLSIFQMFILYIPLAFWGKHLMGITGVFASIVVSYSISGIFSYLLVNRTINLTK